MFAVGCDTVSPVHHHSHADAFDLRLLTDQGADRLADLIVGGRFLPSFLRSSTLAARIGIRQVVLYSDGVVGLGILRIAVDLLRTARHLSLWVETLLGL